MKQAGSMIDEATKKTTSTLNSLKAPIADILDSKEHFDIPTLKELKEEKANFIETGKEAWKTSKDFVSNHKWKAIAVAGAGVVLTGAWVVSTFFKASPARARVSDVQSKRKSKK